MPLVPIQERTQPIPAVALLQRPSYEWLRPNNDAGETNDQQVLRKAKGILNKITPDKFEPLSEQLLEIGKYHLLSLFSIQFNFVLFVVFF